MAKIYRNDHMFKALMTAIGLGGPEYEAKTLTRDVRSLIDMLYGQHGAASMQKIAAEARKQIDEVHRRGINDPQFYARGVLELTELNRAARARRDNIAWSGVTLAIIYIKSEILGDVALPARNAVDGFIDKWSHALPESASSEVESP
tara:strand:- start:10775 stop:11215 length:441 start_codon:yes stop_codon:yes gene_type:complete